jgi:hypothetical protein
MDEEKNLNLRVKNILEKMLSYEAAVQFTWTGKSSIFIAASDSTASLKLAFNDKLGIQCAIYSICQRGGKKNQKEVHNAIHEFIRRAPTRFDRAEAAKKKKGN